MGLRTEYKANTAHMAPSIANGHSPVTPALIVSIVLFLTITCAQYFAAIIGNSGALKADCVSMLVDAISYMGNLMGE